MSLQCGLLGDSFQPTESGRRPLSLTLTDQVGGRLRQEDDREQEEAWSRAGQCQVVPGEEDAQEVAEEDAQRQEEGGQAAELPPQLRAGALSDVDGGGGDAQAHSEPTDGPACQHQRRPHGAHGSHADQQEGGEEDEA